MPIDAAKLRPGNILVISGGNTIIDQAIQIDSILQGQPAAQHVAVVHHRDPGPKGVLWGIEGRPGGVGWVDCTHYVGHPLTVSNIHQPIPEAARYVIGVTMEAMLGTPYDWQAIVEDGGLAFGLPDIWHEKVDGKLPGHIVCSSLAAFGYCKTGQPSPRPTDYRHVSPGDWEKFIIDHRWAG